jgi:hypothetical protein
MPSQYEPQTKRFEIVDPLPGDLVGHDIELPKARGG